MKFCIQVQDTYLYGFFKNKAQGQSQGHVTSAFTCVFLKEKDNKNITLQHGLLDFAYRRVYISQCIHSKLYLKTNSHKKNCTAL